MLPTNERKPDAGKATGFQEIGNVGANSFKQDSPSPVHLQAISGVTDAVKLVKFARNALGAAVYRLDDAGFHCEALNDLHADTSGLVSSWAGRSRPPEIAPVPDYIAESARAWRRQHGRSY